MSRFIDMDSQWSSDSNPLIAIDDVSSVAFKPDIGQITFNMKCLDAFTFQLELPKELTVEEGRDFRDSAFKGIRTLLKEI